MKKYFFITAILASISFMGIADIHDAQAFTKLCCKNSYSCVEAAIGATGKAECPKNISTEVECGSPGCETYGPPPPAPKFCCHDAAGDICSDVPASGACPAPLIKGDCSCRNETPAPAPDPKKGCCFVMGTNQCTTKPPAPMNTCQTGIEIECSSQPACNAALDCCSAIATGQCSHKPVTGCGAGTRAISCAEDSKCPTAPAPTQPPTSSGAITFINPIRFDSVEGVVTSLLDHLMAIIAWIAVLFIVIGGLMYMLAVGDDKKITTAKNIIGAAIIGFAIAIAAPTFLHEVAIILGYDTTSSPTVENAITIKVIVERTLDLLLSIVGIIAIIGLVVGGIFYLTAYGDEDRAKKGKSIITSSIIGIAVALAALMIVKQVFELLV